MLRTIGSLTVIAILLTAIFVPGLMAKDHEKDHEKADQAKMTKTPMETARVGKTAPDFTLTGVDGEKYTLSEMRGDYVVLEWINFDCPFVKKHYHSGNMQALQQKYRDQGVHWLTICSSAPGKQGYFEGEELTDRIEKEKWNGTAYLIDADGRVGKMYNAKTTPNMYVIDPEGVLLYAGAIDNKPTTKQDDIKGSVNYVVETMNAVTNGRDVEVAVTQPYGCSVKYQK